MSSESGWHLSINLNICCYRKYIIKWETFHFQIGEASWDCDFWGRRKTPEPDFSNCTSLINEKLQHLSTSLLQEETKPIEVIETLNDELDKAHELNEQLASGDIETVVRLLDTATDVQKMKVQNDVDLDQDKNLPDPVQFVAQSVQTVNNLGRLQYLCFGL